MGQTDVALRHISRVSRDMIQPQDLQNAELKWPDDLSRFDAVLGASTPVHRVVFVNKDVHIPVRFRHPATAPYILQAISDLSPVLAKRPSLTYVPYSRTWGCPHVGCSYTEDLASLSRSVGEAVRRITAVTLSLKLIANKLVPEFVTIVNGRYRTRKEFVHNVVDMLGLRHYESHLSDAGLCCLIRGQDTDGYVRYFIHQ